MVIRRNEGSPQERKMGLASAAGAMLRALDLEDSKAYFPVFPSSPARAVG